MVMGLWETMLVQYLSLGQSISMVVQITRGTTLDQILVSKARTITLEDHLAFNLGIQGKIAQMCGLVILILD